VNETLPSEHQQKNVKLHENLISKACCLSLFVWAAAGSVAKKGKVKFIFGLFCGFTAASLSFVTFFFIISV
jgi:hypothetical protein